MAHNIQERRKHWRQRVLRSGKISPDGKLSVFDCTVRNVSSRGALVKLEMPQRVPDRFAFTVANESIDTFANVRWRVGNQMGLAFDFPLHG